MNTDDAEHVTGSSSPEDPSAFNDQNRKQEHSAGHKRRRRTRVIKTRVTQEEGDKLEQFAAEAGLDLSAYLRHAGLDRPPVRSSVGRQLLTRQNQLLVLIANRLDEQRHSLLGGDDGLDRLMRAVDFAEIKALLRQILTVRKERRRDE